MDRVRARNMYRKTESRQDPDGSVRLFPGPLDVPAYPASSQRIMWHPVGVAGTRSQQSVRRSLQSQNVDNPLHCGMLGSPATRSRGEFGRRRCRRGKTTGAGECRSVISREKHRPCSQTRCRDPRSRRYCHPTTRKFEAARFRYSQKNAFRRG